MKITTSISVTRAAVALGFGCLLAIGCGKTTPSSGPGGGAGPKASKANFEKIKDGMSEKEVTDVMGSPTASADIDMNMAKDMVKGMPGLDMPTLPGMALPKLHVKSWDEADMLYEVVFKEGKVMAKDSASKKAKVTKENADKIKVGMPRAEVEVILGKGTTGAGTKIEGFSQEVTVWEGADGVISVGFVNDKVAATGGWHKK